MRKLRLLKVIVQPVVVADDGETLEEIPVQPVAVSPADWPGYATGAFADQMEEAEARLNADGGQAGPAGERPEPGYSAP